MTNRRKTTRTAPSRPARTADRTDPGRPAPSLDDLADYAATRRGKRHRCWTCRDPQTRDFVRQVLDHPERPMNLAALHAYLVERMGYQGGYDTLRKHILAHEAERYAAWIGGRYA